MRYKEFYVNRNALPPYGREPPTQHKFNQLVGRLFRGGFDIFQYSNLGEGNVPTGLLVGHDNIPANESVLNRCVESSKLGFFSCSDLGSISEDCQDPLGGVILAPIPVSRVVLQSRLIISRFSLYSRESDLTKYSRNNLIAAMYRLQDETGAVVLTSKTLLETWDIPLEILVVGPKEFQTTHKERFLSYSKKERLVYVPSDGHFSFPTELFDFGVDL